MVLTNPKMPTIKIRWYRPVPVRIQLNFIRRLFSPLLMHGTWPDEMETVAGATQSSTRFKKLVTAALGNALYGLEETALVEMQEE